MLGVFVTDTPLPDTETRLAFMHCYVENANRRLAALLDKDEAWWEQVVPFFEVSRSRAWIVTRRIAHTAHHRGQQMALLRIVNRDVYSNYGPTADTGGLMQSHAPVIYAYPDVETLLGGETSGRAKTPLPGPGNQAPTERPDG